MQMSGGHLLAAGLDGGNTMIFTEGENVIKSRLAGASIVLNTYKPTNFDKSLSVFLFNQFAFGVFM